MTNPVLFKSLDIIKPVLDPAADLQERRARSFMPPAFQRPVTEAPATGEQLAAKAFNPFHRFDPSPICWRAEDRSSRGGMSFGCAVGRTVGNRGPRGGKRVGRSGKPSHPLWINR